MSIATLEPKATHSVDELKHAIRDLKAKRGQLKKRLSEAPNKAAEPRNTESRIQKLLGKLYHPEQAPPPSAPQKDRASLEAELDAVEESIGRLRPLRAEAIQREQEERVRALTPEYRQSLQQLKDAVTVVVEANARVRELEGAMNQRFTFSLDQFLPHKLIEGSSIADWQARTQEFLQSSIKGR